MGNCVFGFFFWLLLIGPAKAGEECKVEISKWTGCYARQVRTQPEFTGIVGEVVLPFVIFDPARYFTVDHSSNPELSGREGPLDRPSVYVGATYPKLWAEIDTGLTWNRIHDSKGRGVLVQTLELAEGADSKNWYRLDKKSVPKLLDPSLKIIATGWSAIEAKIRSLNLHYYFAFAPFYRTTRPKLWRPTHTVFFLPNERVQYSFSRVGNLFTLTLQSTRSKFNVKFVQEGFDEPGVAGYSFKRVNAIDQFRLVDGRPRGNEGPEIRVIPTETTAFGGKWNSFQGIRADHTLVPVLSDRCVQTRFRDTATIYNQIYLYNWLNLLGGESIDITPAAGR